MIKQELLKLSPEERDIIFLWRILYYPKVLTAEEINKCSTHKVEVIQTTVQKFNRNCRLKLELYDHQKDLYKAMESFFCGD